MSARRERESLSHKDGLTDRDGQVQEILPRVGYPKGEEGLAGGRWNVDASRIRVLAFGRDDALEGLGEREMYVHVILSTHHFEGLYGWHSLWPFQRPNVAAATNALQANHLCIRRIRFYTLNSTTSLSLFLFSLWSTANTFYEIIVLRNRISQNLRAFPTFRSRWRDRYGGNKFKNGNGRSWFYSQLFHSNYFIDQIVENYFRCVHKYAYKIVNTGLDLLYLKARRMFAVSIVIVFPLKLDIINV